ncbi:hypothetical protein DL766_005215 [Monosporascus sp. MC13-8B]|uniref:Uncharacterized protein n=1 Tax=Monosporascus cannonballus TaxID=155416 RepID=A0ABY0HGL8_9PEZI|nr:hypothetical protein DL762_001352 [Monosporascus cannonballus]RYP00399.1 hypothetical protein DL763_000865 [Monosporascus cannonballus]RYP29758.1 hypothetical protein DL766_005215 [Monosporascus sp. MC13-8B]
MDDSFEDSTIAALNKHNYDIYVSQSTEDRESVLDAIRQGDFDGLVGTSSSKLAVMTEGYCRSQQSFETFKPLLHDLWYGYYQGGRHPSHSSAEQDRLAFHILRARGMGALTKRARNGSIETAVTLDGVAWEDLPFFVSDMTDFWFNDCACMEAAHRLNFASFLAKLASTGLCNDKLCRIALLVLRETFETVRPLGSVSSSADANAEATMGDLTISDLLPAACAWIREAGRKIVQLSDVFWNDCPGMTGGYGATFTASELGRGLSSSSGFSPQRWMYWLKRLDEIAEEANQAGESSVAEIASEAIDFMLSRVEETDSFVLKEFEAAADDFIGDKNRFSVRHLSSLDEES